MASTLPPIPWDKPQTSFEWVDWYTKLRQVIDTSALDHNQLQNLQGGTSGEYYHLTSAEKTAVGTISDKEATANKNTANGYAGLNASSRVTKGTDTTDDLIIDLATKGLVLKDTQGTPHYWRLTISNVGALVTTDLGTTKP